MTILTSLIYQLNSIPPTTTVSNLRDKLAAARGKCHVDVAFWGGVVPANVNADGELRKMVQVGRKGGTADARFSQPLKIMLLPFSHFLILFFNHRWRVCAASSASSRTREWTNSPASTGRKSRLLSRNSRFVNLPKSSH